MPYPQGRHVRPLYHGRCRHARATPQPVASTATLSHTGRSRASKFSDNRARVRAPRTMPRAGADS